VSVDERNASEAHVQTTLYICKPEEACRIIEKEREAKERQKEKDYFAFFLFLSFMTTMLLIDLGHYLDIENIHDAMQIH
jgi:hypothetical protein